MHKDDGGCVLFLGKERGKVQVEDLAVGGEGDVEAVVGEAVLVGLVGAPVEVVDPARGCVEEPFAGYT